MFKNNLEEKLDNLFNEKSKNTMKRKTISSKSKTFNEILKKYKIENIEEKNSSFSKKSVKSINNMEIKNDLKHNDDDSFLIEIQNIKNNIPENNEGNFDSSFNESIKSDDNNKLKKKSRNLRFKENYIQADVIYWTYSEFLWDEEIQRNMKNIFGFS